MADRVGSSPWDVSIVTPLISLLRRWRLVVGLPVAFAVLSVAYSVLTRGYTAMSSFVPEATGGSQRNQLAGLAQQFGFMLSGSEPTVSVDFYRTLLRSRTVLSEAALTRYRFAEVPGSLDTLEGDLLELYQVEAVNQAARLRKATGLLGRRVTVAVDRAAGVVTVRTAAPWPGLAEQINGRLLALVNQFNVERRNSSAAAQRDFALARLEQSNLERRAAEAELRRFLERNRRYQDSPELVFEHQRLERELELRQQVHTTLAQGYEQARIDAVRDTPVITIIEHPEGSARPEGAARRGGVLGLVFGGILAIGVVMIGEFVARQRRESPEEYRELDRVWGETIARLRPSRSRRQPAVPGEPGRGV